MVAECEQRECHGGSHGTGAGGSEMGRGWVREIEDGDTEGGTGKAERGFGELQQNNQQAKK